MALKDDQGNWLNSQGNPVAASYVTPRDKKRDAMVERLVKKALACQQKIAALRREVDEEFEAYMNYVATKHNMQPNPGGNQQFTNFSGNKRVSVKRQGYIDFNEDINLAKQVIDGCLEKWSEGGNNNLKVVVFDAFKVDKKNQLDKQRILDLRNYNVKDKDWDKAMKLIDSAIYIASRKDYAGFQIREGKNQPWRTVPLDIAKV